MKLIEDSDKATSSGRDFSLEVKEKLGDGQEAAVNGTGMGLLGLR